MDSSSAQEMIDTAVALVSQWGLQVLGAIAVLIVGRWVAGRLRALAVRSLQRASVDATLVPFLAGLV